MQVIKITDYNQIHIIERRDNVIYFKWDNDQRKHRAKIRQDEKGHDYFKSYHLSIRLDQHRPETNKYYIAAYTGGGGIEYTRIFDDSLNGYKPFESIEQAQAYINSGELNEYVYEPSRIVYTKIITAAEKEQHAPDGYRKLWLPINKYPRGPFGKLPA
jgi:hypothetical protein